MSNATSSPSVGVGFGPSQLFSAVFRRLVVGVRATAFWAAALLPFVVLATLFTGLAGQHPTALAGLLAVNTACAVIGHGHSPQR